MAGKMTGETIENVTKTFKFSFPTCSNENLHFKLEVPVDIPHAGSTRELVQRVLRMFHIPVYLEDDLNDKLAKFVEEETKIFYNERDEKLLDQLKNGQLNVDALVKDWEKMFKENVVDFAEQKGTSDEEVFAGAYHKLVHSPALETILQVENSYAKTMMETLKSRDEDISKLTQKQTEEMEEKVRQLNTFTTEADINELATTHFEEQSLAQGRWASQLDALGRAQKHELRNWLMNTLEEYQSTSALNTPSNSPLASFPKAPLAPPAPLAASAPLAAPAPRARILDESYTIHLGSQLKHTHNIRLITLDPLELCSAEHVDNPAEASRRLQTALGLYSSDLSAVVLVSDGHRSHITQQLARAAKTSTDYHFPDFDTQIQTILMKLNEPLEQRQKGGKRLQCGDVLITRHSNLSDSHIVFHLIADDSVSTGDITSRHPVMLGLRNILRAATQNDVTSIAIPLLLTHELAEEATAAWCSRRAELVLKCVKGFMVEAAGGGGAPLRTLVLCAPPSLAAAAAAALAALPPATFTVTTPLKLTAP